MLTSEFKYYNSPFKEYNLVQSKVIPWIDKDYNLVIAFATATGKSALATAAFSYHLKTTTKRVVYLCPFKALVDEKYNDWTNDAQLSQYGIIKCDGENKVSINDLEKNRFAIMTIESFDVKTRSFPLYKDYLNSIDCVVLDEAQILGERKGVAEACLMRLTQINPNIRLILLSATIGNPELIARWIKSLNSKPTKWFASEWRPRKIDINLYEVSSYSEKINQTIALLKEPCDGQTLVFVHAKQMGKEIIKRLKKKKISANFHHAGVGKNKRHEIEQGFSSGEDKILISTSSLSAGVNLS